MLRGKNLGDVLYGGAGDDQDLWGGAGMTFWSAALVTIGCSEAPARTSFRRWMGRGTIFFGGPDSDRGTWDIGRDKTKSVEDYDSE